MIAFPSLLVEAATQANIPTPPDPDNYLPEEFPQFHLFCCAQLGRPMSSWTNHWDNAHVIAKIKPEDCPTITVKQLLNTGFKE